MQSKLGILILTGLKRTLRILDNIPIFSGGDKSNSPFDTREGTTDGKICKWRNQSISMGNNTTKDSQRITHAFSYLAYSGTAGIQGKVHLTVSGGRTGSRAAVKHRVKKPGGGGRTPTGGGRTRLDQKPRTSELPLVRKNPT